MAPGGNVTITVNNFAPNVTVQFFIGAAAARTAGTRPAGRTLLGSATTNATGTATFSFTAPATAGTYTITAVAACCANAATTVTVAAAAPTTTAPADIPATGGSTDMPIAIGALLLAAGASLVGVAAVRRRKPAVA